MSIISWNCRGLGSLSAIPNLKFLVRYYKPDALFLRETLVFKNKMEEFHYVLGFDYCFAVDRQGRSGGIALFWRNSFNCKILNYSQNHIIVLLLIDKVGVRGVIESLKRDLIVPLMFILLELQKISALRTHGELDQA